MELFQAFEYCQLEKVEEIKEYEVLNSMEALVINHKNNDKYNFHYNRTLTILDTENLSLQGCFDQIERRLENMILLTVSTEGLVTLSFHHEK